MNTIKQPFITHRYKWKFLLWWHRVPPPRPLPQNRHNLCVCFVFFVFFQLRDEDCAATALFQTQQCGADAVMEVGGRGTTWPKQYCWKVCSRSRLPAAASLSYSGSSGAPFPHSSSNCPFFMNKIWFGLTYFFPQCPPVPLIRNVSSDTLKWTIRKTKLYRLAFVSYDL